MRRLWTSLDCSRCVHRPWTPLDSSKCVHRPWTPVDCSRCSRCSTTINDVFNLEDASTIPISILFFFWREGVFSHILSISHLSSSSHQYTFYSLPLVWVTRYWRKKHFIPVEIGPVPMVVKKKSKMLKVYKRTRDGPGVIRKTCLSFQLGWAKK